MTRLLYSLRCAVCFTRKAKVSNLNLLTISSFREAEFRRYLLAAQAVYPMWVYLLNERPHILSKYAELVVNHVGYMLYRVQEIRALNRSLPLLPQNQIVFLLDTLNEMYNSLIEISAPDAVQQVYDVLLNTSTGHGTV
ncbi:UNVERIFIED_ORG: hypothetical protein DFS12_101461 [Chitinophaga ginsengisegetis]